MGAYAAGQVILLRFPFSDLTQSKYRPALLLADAGRGDWIACQITSKPYGDDRAVGIVDADFRTGGLQRASFARPGKLFTAHETLFVQDLGVLHPHKLTAIREAVVAVVRESGL